MAGKSVATKDDISAIPGTVMYTGAPTGPAQTGKWTAGEITVTAHPKLHVGAAPVISEVTCTFSFAGANSAGTVAGSVIVTLAAGATTLQAGVLVDGDQASDAGAPPVPTFGNKLTVTSARELTTT